jgi:hypothetical protein
MSFAATRLPERRPAVAKPRPGRQNAAAFATGPHDHWMQLQRGVGNQAAMRLGQQPSPAGQAELETAPVIVHDILSHPGAPLPSAVEATMGARLHHDFGDVRVHTGDRAAASAKAVGAAAYTVGRDIVFDTGQFQPASPDGQRLLAHELVHTIQQSGAPGRHGGEGLAVAPADNVLERQAASAVAAATSEAGSLVSGNIGQTATPQLQRQPAKPDPAADIEAHLTALFAEYEKVKGKPVPPSMQEWARKYERARQNVPEAPPLDVERLAQAIELRRIHNVEPPLPQMPQALQLAPGAVGANDIFPFAKGSRVLVTQLFGDILAKFKDRILSLAGSNLSPDATTLIDILTDKTVAKSVEAVVEESSPTLFEASIAVPEIPAKGARAAIPARNIRLRVEATSAEPKFDLSINWKTGRTTFGDIKAHREGDKIVINLPSMAGMALDLSLKREATGAVLVETDQQLVKLLVGDTLKLVRIEPLSGPAGSAEDVKQKAAADKNAAATATRLPSAHELSASAGIGWSQGAHPMFSAGYRFLFRPVGEVVRFPLAVQLDYLPGAQLGIAGIGIGAEGRLPTSVPVTLSLQVGLKGGVAAPGGGERLPVFGPSAGLEAGVNVTKGLNVHIGGGYMRNMLDAAQKRDVTNVPSLAIGATLRL